VEKELINWINEQKKAKVPKEESKKALLSQGYSDKDIKKIFLETNNTYQFFKPTFIKLAIVILFAATLIISSIVNINYIPEKMTLVSDSIIKTSESASKLREFKVNSANVNEYLNLLQEQNDASKESNDNNRKLLENIEILAIPNIIVLVDHFYIIDPLYPEPCEILMVAESNGLIMNVDTSFCKYYSTKEIYMNINNFMEKQKQNREGIRMIFFGTGDSIPGYKKVSVLEIIIHTIVFILILYTLISVISSVCSMIKIPSILKTVLGSIFLALFIISIIAVIIITPLTIKTINVEEYHETEFILKECINSTQIQNNAAVQENNSENITTNVCSNPACYEVCDTICDVTNVIEIPGEIPSCVCGCIKNK